MGQVENIEEDSEYSEEDLTEIGLLKAFAGKSWRELVRENMQLRDDLADARLDVQHYRQFAPQRRRLSHGD